MSSVSHRLINQILSSGLYPSLSAFRLDYEISKSFSILFATSENSSRRHKSYSTLPVPEWLKNSQANISTLKESDYQEIRFHLAQVHNTRDVLRSVLNKQTLCYSRFPNYEQRLRELRAYMDSCNPTGLRALWRDKRNTLNYYTFWGVIVFGTLSVVLAIFSLGVSAAQTYATFKALHPGP